MRRDCYTALSLNGTSHLVAGTNALTLTAFTMSAWVRRTKTTGVQPVISGGSGSACLRINASNGIELAKIGGSVVGVASGNEVVTRLDYVHIAAAYDGATVRLYVNGVRVVSAAGVETFSAATYGVGTDGTNYYGGTVDEAVIVGRALSDAEVMALAFSGPDVVAPRLLDWRFDEAAGTSVVDYSGTGNTGTITGATYSRLVPLQPPNLKRNMGYAGNFNGTNARIDLDATLTNAALVGASAVTVSLWFRYLTPWQAGRLFGAYTSSASVAILLWITGTAAAQQLALSGRSRAADSSVATTLTNILEPGNWMHVVGVFDYANKIEAAYVNGILRASTNASAWGQSTLETSNSGGAIGGFSGGDWFRGQMDDVRVYRRALTSAEIRRGYLTGQWPESPTLLWTFDDASSANTGTASVGVTPANMTYVPSMS